jgi:hypothetical protein
VRHHATLLAINRPQISLRCRGNCCNTILRFQAKHAHARIMRACGHRSSCYYPRSALPTFAHYSSGMWKTRLLKPIRLEDGRIIRTLDDTHDVILQLPEKELRRPQWQALAGLLLSADTTRQHHLLFILTVRLETELPKLAHAAESVQPPKKPPQPSMKHRLKRGRKTKLLK